MYRKCERVITKWGRVEYCENMALFVTPPGIWTKRIISVCNVHKKELAVYHKYKLNQGVFIKISDLHIPEYKEKVK